MEDHKGLDALVQELAYLRVAVSSLNPDPQETTHQYRRRQQRLLMIAVMAVSGSASALVISLFALLRNCH